MKRVLFSSFFVILIFSFISIFAENNYFLNNELYIENADITGNKSNSYLTEGNNFKNDMSFGLNYSSGDFRQNLNLNLFATDDYRFSSKKAVMRNFLWQIQKGKYMFSAGDIFADFSEYSLNNALKGLRLNYYGENSMDIDIIAGINKSQWYYLWDNDSNELKDTYHAGISIRKQLLPFFDARLNYVFTNEDKARNALYSTKLYRTNVISLNWNYYPVSALRLYGESAYSNYYEKGHSTDDSWAHKINLDVRGNNLRNRFVYERVDSDFYSPGGIVITDREKMEVRNSYYLKKGEIYLNYVYYHDNLNDSKTATTYNHFPEAGFRYDGIFNRPTLSLDYNFRFNRRYADDSLLDTRDYTSILSLSDRFGEYELRLTYTLDYINDDTATDDDSTLNSANIDISRRFIYENGMIMPSVFIYAEKTNGSSSDYSNINSGFRLNGEFDRLNFMFNYNIGHLANTSSDDLTNTYVVCSLEYRLTDNGKYGRNIAGLKYSVNDNNYQTSSQDYKEKVLAFYLKTEF